ncbi:bifunctional riboflavin kinase/FAD synthetase [Francisella sp. Scap27]|uniref:bifunctional riboflavin kinase/FAD synthetase n=1 Tax=Francisella sp. Scap27 TaxID=2589986 RepID=UPI0015B956A6|nr:bifunctional riboflavin kinase/FAD synthetase [Francisella sp. Scap27]QLE79476.1 bifunctional riboflavin kinase/FAD synthetase [Francisella sp. Scap27]
MKITTHFKKMNNTAPAAIAIGSFDGVHLGHQSIIKKLKSIAKKNNLKPFILFFEPLPKEFFMGSKSPSRINNFRNKILNIKKAGIDNVICQKFNQKFANIEAEDFIDFLIQKLNVKHIIIGDDFKFGKNRKGDFKLLEALSKEKGFTIDKISTLNLDNHRISSTDIRKSFANHDLRKVHELLGENYKINGRVIHGQQNGRKIGFHTANLKLPKNSVLKGVFLTKTSIDKAYYYGVTNAGTRPTVDGKNNLLETHLFDFDQDIYKKYITVEIIGFIRAERKFANFDELKDQIANDVQTAKAMIAEL